MTAQTIQLEKEKEEEFVRVPRKAILEAISKIDDIKATLRGADQRPSASEMGVPAVAQRRS